MKNIIIVSKCLRVINLKGAEVQCYFHFKGVCAGETLNKVILTKPGELEIKAQQEYLMYVQFHSCEKGVLRGKILKARLLEECWDRS